MNSAADIEQQAAKWLARHDADNWSERDQAALNEWIDASTAHRIAWLRLESVWAKADRLRASKVEEEMPPAPPANFVAANDERGGAPRSAKWTWGAVAAALLLAVAIPGYRYLTHPVEAYATAVGGFQQLPLADGSRVDLNTDTILNVAFSRDERRVSLTKGEAFFKVAKDKTRPFIVEAGRYRVIAVGTAFTVRMKGDDVDVLVTEGRVRIEGPGQSSHEQVAFVAAGQAAVVERSVVAPIVKPAAPDQLEAALSWRDGLLIFESRPLGEVAAEFNRYNREQLVVDPSATGVIVDGTFRATNVEGFLRLLHQGFAVQSVRRADDAILLKRS